MTISQAINDYLQSVRLARSPRTAATYKNALQYFTETIVDNQVDPATTLVTDLPENSIIWMTGALKNHAATTERLYLTAVTGFFNFK